MLLNPTLGFESCAHPLVSWIWAKPGQLGYMATLTMWKSLTGKIIISQMASHQNILHVGLQIVSSEQWG